MVGVVFEMSVQRLLFWSSDVKTSAVWEFDRLVKVFRGKCPRSVATDESKGIEIVCPLIFGELLLVEF